MRDAAWGKSTSAVILVYSHTYFQHHRWFCYKIQLPVNFSGDKHSESRLKRQLGAAVLDVGRTQER